MRRTLVAALVAVLTLLTSQAAWGIVYGEPDDGDHPNVGALVAVFTDEETGQEVRAVICSGTLVDADTVLTASHCLVGLPLPEDTEMFVTFAEVVDQDGDSLVDEGVPLLAGTPHVHPLFGAGGQSDPHDIAVFELDRDLRGLTPARLPEAGLLDDPALRAETFTAVGYGAVRETNRKAFESILRAGRRFQAEQHILSVTPSWVTFSMNLATGNGGTCYGDSGGPHFLGDVVVSVTVTGDTVCKATDKTYRTDTESARSFLAEFVTLP